MFYYEIWWFCQGLKSENLCFLNLFSVLGVRMLDLSLEIRLNPSKERRKDLHNSESFSFIQEQWNSCNISSF